MTLSCVASGCVIPRRHVPGCADDGCYGCLPGLAEDGVFCIRCASRLRTWLAELPDLFTEVVDPPSVRDERTWDSVPRDPIAYPLPAGPVNGTSRQPRVSGSHEDAVPARFVEAGPGALTVHDPVGAGYVPPAVLLDSWARDWQTHRGEHLPVPTVAELCRWLSARLGWALRHHRAVGDFYSEIRETHARLWAEAGRGEAKPEPCQGVPCRRCDRMTLFRVADGSGDVECHTEDCRTVYRADEYVRWVKLVAAHTAG